MFRNKLATKKPNGTNYNNSKPSFIMIANIYDELKMLCDRYGFEKVVLHLGQVAYDTVGRDLGMKIWGSFRLGEKIERGTTEED